MAEEMRDFDVIGLQEVVTLEGVKNFAEALTEETGSEWDYRISATSAGENNHFIGFMWNTDQVYNISDEPIPFTVTYEDGFEFYRPPWAMTFKAGEFDFTYVVWHAIHTAAADTGEFNTKREEAEKLVDVYNFYQGLDENEQDIIIGADFNNYLDNGDYRDLYNIDGFTTAINPTIKTLVKEGGLEKPYDNILISDYTTEFTGNAGVLAVVDGYLGQPSDFINYNISFSDHLPVWIEVSTLVDDD